MVDFRKWFPALAVVALAFGAASTASAGVPAFSCISNADNPPVVTAQAIDQIVEGMVGNNNAGVNGIFDAAPAAQNVSFNGNTNNIDALISVGVNDRFVNPVALRNLGNEKIFKVKAACFVDNAPVHGSGVAIANQQVNSFNSAGYGANWNNNANTGYNQVSAPDIAGNIGAAIRVNYHSSPPQADHPAQVTLRE